MTLDVNKEIERLKDLCRAKINNDAPNEWDKFLNEKMNETLKLLGE